jgi:hypothetical protein
MDEEEALWFLQSRCGGGRAERRRERARARTRHQGCAFFSPLLAPVPGSPAPIEVSASISPWCVVWGARKALLGVSKFALQPLSLSPLSLSLSLSPSLLHPLPLALPPRLSLSQTRSYQRTPSSHTPLNKRAQQATASSLVHKRNHPLIRNTNVLESLFDKMAAKPTDGMAFVADFLAGECWRCCPGGAARAQP